MSDEGQTHYVGDDCPGGHKEDWQDKLKEAERALYAAAESKAADYFARTVARLRGQMEQLREELREQHGPCLGDGPCPTRDVLALTEEMEE